MHSRTHLRHECSVPEQRIRPERRPRKLLPLARSHGRRYDFDAEGHETVRRPADESSKRGEMEALRHRDCVATPGGPLE